MRQLAPVTAVIGNVDVDKPWAAAIPDRVELKLLKWRLLLVHNSNELDTEQLAGRFDLVVSGHSHHPGWHRTDDLSWLNPGSAGRRRFKLPVSLALLELNDQRMDVQMIELAV